MKNTKLSLQDLIESKVDTLKEETIKSGLITEKEYDKIVDPEKMTTPN